MKVGYFYNAKEFDPAWSKFLWHPFVQYDVPTETLVLTPRYVVPVQARAFRTNRYLLRGEVVDYEVLRKEPEFHGSYQYREIWMAEVWTDKGSDGHIHYTLVGFRFVPEDVLQLKRTWWNGQGSLPEAMLEQLWDRMW